MSFVKKAGFTNKKRVICEVLRELYDILFEAQLTQEEGKKVLALLEEANTMAKKMNDKLYEYAYNVTEESEDNSNYQQSVELRKGRDVHS